MASTKSARRLDHRSDLDPGHCDQPEVVAGGDLVFELGQAGPSFVGQLLDMALRSPTRRIIPVWQANVARDD